MTLLASWSMTETGNTFFDSSGNGFNIDVSAFGFSDIEKGYSIAGLEGAYFHLRSVGDVCPKVITSDTRLNLNDSWTIQFRFCLPATRHTDWPRTTTYGDFPGLVTFGQGTNFDGGDVGWMLFYSERNEPFQNYGPGTDPRVPAFKREGVSLAGTLVSESVWHTAMVTHDAGIGETKTYADNVLTNTQSVVYPDRFSSVLRFGSNQNYGYHQKARCVLREVKIYDQVLLPITASGASIPLRQRQRPGRAERMRQQVR